MFETHMEVHECFSNNIDAAIDTFIKVAKKKHVALSYGIYNYLDDTKNIT